MNPPSFDQNAGYNYCLPNVKYEYRCLLNRDRRRHLYIVLVIMSDQQAGCLEYCYRRECASSSPTLSSPVCTNEICLIYLHIFLHYSYLLETADEIKVACDWPLNTQ